MTSPTLVYDVSVAVFVIARCGFRAAVIVSGASGALTSVEVACPVSKNEPASRSACVIACVPVHTTDAPGANDATGNVTATPATLQANPASTGVSDTDTACNVTLPFFLAVTVYV